MAGRQKYKPFPALLTAEQHAFVAARALIERTSKNDVVRRSIDYYRFFVSSDTNGRSDRSDVSNKEP